MKRRTALLWLAGVVSTAGAAGAAGRGSWSQVHPRWKNAYVLSFRSPDLLTNEPDERWGAEDDRLVSGNILDDFPRWLQDHVEELRSTLDMGRPVLLSLHTHGGYGVGLVTYSPDLLRAQVANYPWLIRQLDDAGLNREGVTVTVDTCNAQAAAAHQLRPDLVRGGVEAWPPFVRWRKVAAARRAMALPEAFALFARDRVAQHLERPAVGRRENVEAAPYEPLTQRERSRLRMRLYGPQGVILATPALSNVLRLGPNVKGTLTADLLRDPLNTAVVDRLLAQNTAEFRRFNQYSFLAQAAFRGGTVVTRNSESQRYSRGEMERGTVSRDRRVEHGEQD